MEPVEMEGTSLAGPSPSRMIVPLPCCFSICPTAISSDFRRSLLFLELDDAMMGRTGFGFGEGGRETSLFYMFNICMIQVWSFTYEFFFIFLLKQATGLTGT